METTDPLQEWQRLSEYYRGKFDEELELIAEKAYQLTDTARQALQSEIRARGLDIPLAKEPADPDPPEESEAVPGYFDDADALRAPTWVCQAGSLEEAQEAKGILQDAGIASFLGEGTTDPDFFPSSFRDGVDLFVPAADAQRALLLLQRWMPTADSPSQPGDSENETDDTAILCPQCQSQEVVLLRVMKSPDGDSGKSKFRWRCDSCQHVWIDDGIEKQTS